MCANNSHYKITLLIFSLLIFSGIIFANSVSYSLTTQYPSSTPYFVGTQIQDLKITFLDVSNNIIAQNIDTLNVKMGKKIFSLQKNKSNEYHLKNIILSEDLVQDNKLTIKITTPLDSSFANIQQSYSVKSIEDKIKIINNPKEDYSNLTISQNLWLALQFESIQEQNITNISCFLDNLNSDKEFTWEGLESTHYSLKVSKDLKELNIYCLFEKTENSKKEIIPYYVNIPVTLSEGFKILQFTNPKDGVIGNPFSFCFEGAYENGMYIIPDTEFKLLINDKEKDYSYDSYYGIFCVSDFLIPYTTFDKKITFEQDKKQYSVETTTPLKSGLVWNIFFVVVGLFILFNLIFLIRTKLHKETIVDLIKKRDSYQEKIKLIREDYLSGDLEKEEFEDKLKEYTIKMSLLNERIIIVKKEERIRAKKQVQAQREIRGKEKIETEVPTELLSIINEEPEQTDEEEQKEKEGSMEQIKEVPEEDTKKLIASITNSEPVLLEKKESFFEKIKNLFKKKPKEKKEDGPKVDLEKEFGVVSNNDDFDVKKWIK